MRLFFSISLCLLALPASAVAQDIPPENSGVGQYVENVPGAGGDKPSSDVDPTDPDAADALAPDQQEALEELGAQGADGEAAAGLAASTAPGQDGADRIERGASDIDGASAADTPPIGNVLGQLTGTDVGGMGVGLPIVLVVSLVGAVALMIARRRRSRATPM